MLVAKRSVTISPLQSLAMLNNKLTLVMSKNFAERVEKGGGNVNDQVTAAFTMALCRAPGDEELAPLVEYARRHGLANACRVLLNLNEFVFVD